MTTPKCWCGLPLEVTGGDPWDDERGQTHSRVCPEHGNDYEEPTDKALRWRIAGILGDLYTVEEAAEWLASPQKLLDGRTPHSLMSSGESEKVLQILETISAGGS